MPYKDLHKKNKYAREWRLRNRDKVEVYYQSQRIKNAELRIKYLTQLGGRCVECNESNLDLLEFDHISFDDKKFAIGRHINLSEEIIQKELKKCQLLCFSCHRLKHRNEHGEGAIGINGCKCQECRDRKNSYMREYRNT